MKCIDQNNIKFKTENLIHQAGRNQFGLSIDAPFILIEFIYIQLWFSPSILGL